MVLLRNSGYAAKIQSDGVRAALRALFVEEKKK